MKKLLALLAIFALILGCMLSFTSCGKKDDGKEDESENGGNGDGNGDGSSDNLDGDTSIIPDFEPAKAKKGLEKNGYTVTVLCDLVSSAQQPPESGLVYNLTAFKISSRTDVIALFYYADEATASLAYAEIERLANEEKEIYGDGIVMGRSFNMIWYGTVEAVKAAQ